MQPEIGSVIAKGLSVVYKEKPKNPVDYFAKWLLKQSSIIKQEKEQHKEELKVAELKGINDWNNKKDRKEKERAVLKKKDLDDEIADFRNRVSISTDQTVLLDELSTHVAKFTGATACYVGKVDMPIKKSTSDGDFDGSHVIKEGDKDPATGQSIVPEIQWLSATDDHAYMKG